MEQSYIARIQRSVDEHTPEYCPFKSHAYGSIYHGDDCRWAARTRERWLDDEIKGLAQAAAKLAERNLV